MNPTSCINRDEIVISLQSVVLADRIKLIQNGCQHWRKLEMSDEIKKAANNDELLNCLNFFDDVIASGHQKLEK